MGRITDELRTYIAVLKESWPLIIAESISSIAWLVDTFFVSLLGDVAVAGVGAGGYGSWLLGAFNTPFYVGVMILASQAIGASARDKASRVTGESTTAAVLLSSAAAGIAYLIADDFMLLLTSDPATASMASTYLRARIWGLPGLTTFLVLDAAYRAAKKNKDILYASLLSAMVNAVLDPILIFYAGLGVAGAGIATAVSFYAGAAALLVYPRRRLGFSPWPRIPRGYAVRSLALGLPAFAERILMNSAHGFYIGAISRCGSEALAAQTIGVRIESIAFMPGFALNTYASSAVGQLVGAGRIEEAKEEGWRIAKVAFLMMSFAGAALVAISPYVPYLFGVSEEVAYLSMIYLLMAAASEPFLGLVYALTGGVRGAGNTLVPTAINAAGMYLFRVAPSVAIAALHPFSGMACPVAIWAAMDADVIARSLILAVVYRRGLERLAKRLIS